jgi:predicted RNA-binding Zn ribbon-like protein
MMNAMLRRLAGHPALDFVNTIDPREGEGGIEYLRSFEDLIDWARRAGVLRRSDAEHAVRAAENDAAASRAFARAVRLREAIYAIFSAVVARRPEPREAFEELESAYRQAMSHARLTRTRSGFSWRLESGLDRVRWQIAREAVALLESERLGRVKRCPGSGDCGWLFLDSSKSRTRRWCSMDGCGNRAKVRRFQKRRQRVS